MKRLLALAAVISVCCVIVGSCATNKKLATLQTDGISEELLALAEKDSYIPDVAIPKVTRDTIRIKDETGHEFTIMKARRDEESGEMIATEMLTAAVVTARFTNIPERKGMVNIAFQITVPERMQDSKWQLRFYPDMFYLQDSIRLDPVYITGKDYRKTQMRGYQQYEKFLSTIISDSTAFIDKHLLEVFIRRNIPQVYAFKNDTTFVSDEQFHSAYGVSEQEAVDHYTNSSAVNRNERRKASKDRMFNKYVKSPIVTEGIRLDTVMQNSNGDFVYNYVQSVRTRRELRKIDIVLSGEIYEQEEMILPIPASDPLTFYISSLSEFTDYQEHYLKQVVERQVQANTTGYVEFETGKSRVREDLGDNASEIARIKECLADLMNNETFELDSIVVSAYASPEGSVAANRRLSQQRSDAISRYFNDYMKVYRRELEQERGFSIDEEGNVVKAQVAQIPFISRSFGENWEMLDFLVEGDRAMDEGVKEHYASLKGETDLDRRESILKKESYYKYMFDNLYPRLRTVKFNFNLHRKGMVKDTVETTVLDSTYMRGLEALKDKDYESAIRMLGPYGDFNTAVAYVAMERNTSAMLILQGLERDANVNYLLAILYSRAGDEQQAVNCYLQSCRQNPSYVHRGNLDPEISILIKEYNLNSFDDDYQDDLMNISF